MIEPTILQLQLAKNGFTPASLKQLAESKDPQAQFLWHIFKDVYDYCVYHLPSIAHDAEDIDAAMRLGFGWQMGPFALWRAAGLSQTCITIAIAAKEKGRCQRRPDRASQRGTATVASSSTSSS